MSSSSPFFDRENIRDLVAKNQNETVINALVNLAKRIENKDLSNSIILLSNKYENFVKDARDGVLSTEQKEVSESKLNAAILELIDDIPEESFNLLSQFNKQKSKSAFLREDGKEDKLMKYGIFSLFIFGFLVLVFGIIWYAVSIMSQNDHPFQWTDLILPIAGLTVMSASAFLYFLIKR